MRLWPLLLILACASVARAQDLAADDAGVAQAAGADEVAAPGAVTTAGEEAGAEAAREAAASQAAGPEAHLPAVAPLPPPDPDPSLVPLLEGPKRDEPEGRAVPPSERPEVVVKTIIGLLLLLVLAYLGGHPRVIGLEEKLGVSQVVTAGFPFVLLGMVARLPSVGVLSDSVLSEIAPLLRLGLGWIGFVVGFRFDARLFEGLPGGTARLVTLSTLLPFGLVVAVSSVVLFLSGDASADSLRDPVFLRDAVILGTAGAMTAHTATRLFGNGDGLGIVPRIIRIEELAGIAGLAFVAAYFRPQGTTVSWQLPGTAWLLVTIGLGTAAGLLFYAILQRASAGPDFLVLTLGSISFAAGAAGYLRLSSVVVAFFAGVLLANFPGPYHERLREILLRIERPIYLISLVIIGALWRVGDWRGWLLMPVFMAMRLLGKALALRFLRNTEPALRAEERQALSIAPVGSLSIAIVVNAQLLYPGGSISLIVSAVIGGSILTEVLLQLAGHKQRKLRNSVEMPAVREGVDP